MRDLGQSGAFDDIARLIVSPVSRICTPAPNFPSSVPAQSRRRVDNDIGLFFQSFARLLGTTFYVFQDHRITDRTENQPHRRGASPSISMQGDDQCCNIGSGVLMTTAAIERGRGFELSSEYQTIWRAT